MKWPFLCEIQHLKYFCWIWGRCSGYPSELGSVSLSGVPLPEAGPVLENIVYGSLSFTSKMKSSGQFYGISVVTAYTTQSLSLFPNYIIIHVTFLYNQYKITKL